MTLDWSLSAFEKGIKIGGSWQLCKKADDINVEGSICDGEF